MIREKQQNEYQKMFSDKPNESRGKNDDTASSIVDNFKNDFEQSINYLNSLEKKNTPPKNQTLKNYSSNSYSPNPSNIYGAPSGNMQHDFENVNLVLPNELNQSTPIQLREPHRQYQTYNQKPLPTPSDMPKYGCLKHGKLKTYRTMMNLTQKNRGQESNLIQNNASVPGPVSGPSPSVQNDSVVNLMKESQIERIKQKSTIKQMKNQIDNLKKPSKMKQLKQRKIARRTYRIGKSKILPKVSVLVSNRTLRNNITTKAQLLKQTPISEIKHFLVKRGFIKVGSNTPNDILRKMYESISLICGEVQNHNSENLLYNYLHSDLNSIK